MGFALKLFLFTENRELGPFSTFPPEIVNHISGYFRNIFGNFLIILKKKVFVLRTVTILIFTVQYVRLVHGDDG